MSPRPHPMLEFGDPIDPDNGGEGSFASSIHPHSKEAENASAILKQRRQPYNANSFLLISPGPDGLYGTPDDIRNFRR